jgi:DNA ligase 1
LNHKPMLAVDCGDVNSLCFPLVASPKMDGVRAIVSADGLLSRSLKPIPNGNVQRLFAGLPIGLDGELLAGSPTAPDVYRKTVSMVMSDDAPIDGLAFHVFDIQEDRPWEERNARTESAVRLARNAGRPVAAVLQVPAFSADDLLFYESKWVEMGYEGAILRAPGSPYKHGRSTRREGYLLKLKRFQDAEAVAIGVTELMHNGNEAKTNELGRTARSHKKAGLVGAGVMGTLVVRDVKTGVEFEIGTGFKAEERQAIWYTKEEITQAGWLCKYKHFPSGAKDKPRHPVFLGWRDQRDMD